MITLLAAVALSSHPAACSIITVIRPHNIDLQLNIELTPHGHMEDIQGGDCSFCSIMADDNAVNDAWDCFGVVVDYVLHFLACQRYGKSSYPYMYTCTIQITSTNWKKQTPTTLWLDVCLITKKSYHEYQFKKNYPILAHMISMRFMVVWMG